MRKAQRFDSRHQNKLSRAIIRVILGGSSCIRKQFQDKIHGRILKKKGLSNQQLEVIKTREKNFLIEKKNQFLLDKLGLVPDDVESNIQNKLYLYNILFSPQQMEKVFYGQMTGHNLHWRKYKLESFIDSKASLLEFMKRDVAIKLKVPQCFEKILNSVIRLLQNQEKAEKIERYRNYFFEPLCFETKDTDDSRDTYSDCRDSDDYECSQFTEVSSVQTLDPALVKEQELTFF